jgi:hypothetical protein
MDRWTDMAISSGIAWTRVEPTRADVKNCIVRSEEAIWPSKCSRSVRGFLATLAVRGPARTTPTPTCMNDGLMFGERLSRGARDVKRP